MTNVTDRLSGVSEGVAFKAPCRCATSANITLTGLQTIGGVLTTDAMRVLVRAQTDQTENGIWLASSGNWTRAGDFDGNNDVVTGSQVLDVNTRIFYCVTSEDPITIGEDAITFAPITEALFVSVADYGAVGNGVTDDTSAINLAAAALASTGGILFFPRTSVDVYIIQPLTIGNGTWNGSNVATAVSSIQNITLMGEVGHGGTTALDSGAKSIKLKYKATATNGGIMLTFAGPGSFAMENLDLDANGGRAGYGLFLRGVYRSGFENVTIENFSVTGMIHQPTPTLPSGLFISASANEFKNVTIRSTAYGATCGADIGLQDATAGSFDVSRDTFENLEIEITDSASASCLNLRGADLLTFINPFWSSPGQRRAKSLYVIPPTSDAYLPANITFINPALIGTIFTPTDGTWTPNASGSNNLAEGLYFSPLSCGDMMAPGFTGRAGLPANAPYGGINGFTTDGRRLGSEPSAQTGTSYTVLSSDNGRIVTFSNAAATAVTLAQPTAYNGFGPNWDTLVQNIGVGVVTITPTSATINGLATLVLRKGQGARIRSDGTNYTAGLFETRTTLFAATADGSALTNSNTLTTLKTSAQTIPANTLQAGTVIRGRASGLYTASNAGSVNRTITINAAIGGTSVCYIAQVLSINETAVDWHFEFSVVVRSTGVSGSMLSGFTVGAVWPYAGGAGVSQGAKTIDTTAANAVAVQGQWSAADSTTSITCKSLTIEVINPGSTG